MFHINKIYIDHLHLHNDEKLDEILDAINNRNDNEFFKAVKEVTKKMKASIKDLKQTPLT